jgi:hypothetical protein
MISPGSFSMSPARSIFMAAFNDRRLAPDQRLNRLKRESARIRGILGQLGREVSIGRAKGNDPPRLQATLDWLRRCVHESAALRGPEAEPVREELLRAIAEMQNAGMASAVTVRR